MSLSELQNPVFVIWAFTFQVILIVHFVVRRLALDIALEYGWIVYTLGLVAAVVSIQQILRGESWSFWLGGFLYLVWAVFGFLVEYQFNISWRTPINWPIFLPFIGLYLATVMFYWWPLGIINKNLWYVYTVLFVIGTWLNVTSHNR